jgi:putative restriction endonuclease
VPLLYLEGVAKGRYPPSAAAIIEDHPESLTFGVQLIPIDAAAIGAVNAFALDPATRRHYLALVRRRTGQARFRETVLDAYASRCTLCRLRHRELLDAAHIVSYAEGGTHLVTNGMSMCKIHHAAYDLDIVGVRPDGVAEVRADGFGGGGRADAPPWAAGGARREAVPATVVGDAAFGGGTGATVRAVSGAGSSRDITFRYP